MKCSDVLCDYCNNETEYVDSKIIYGRSYGMVYYCKPCDAWVGVHKGTDKPLGRLANAELRFWKKKAHAAFDPVWKDKTKKRRDFKKFERSAAYRWLAGELGISLNECHIGMFDIDMCKKVVEMCND